MSAAAGSVPGTVKREDQGAVSILRLSRPGRRNAFGADLASSLAARLRELAEDDVIRACVLVGEGDTFSSGADIGQSDTHNVTQVGAKLAAESPQADVFAALINFSRPIVSAVDGYAIGAGFLMALCTDIIVVSESVQFSLPQVPLGIIPAMGGLSRLAAWVGRGRAMEIGLTGRRVGAEEAYRIGLAAAVVPSDQLLGHALSIATKLASYPPLAMRFAKESLNESFDEVLVKPAAKGDYYRFTCLMATEDTHEAHAAWREKRQPVFRGR